MATKRVLSFMIRHARESRGLSQSALATKAGVKQPTVAAWESGASPLSEATLDKIAEAVGIDTIALLREGIAAFEAAQAVPR
jgi:transcriptional regulator with XRE-family HTH domain